MPSSCCAAGSLHTGTPVGRVEKIHGRDCYVSDAPAGSPVKGIVVFIPDIFGWTLPNSRILADEYAKKANATVYLPDFQNGYIFPAWGIQSMHALSETGLAANIAKIYHFALMAYYFIPFLIRNPASSVRPQIHDFFKALRADEASSLPVAVAGFCWGGKWAVELCADEVKADSGKSLVDCAFTAHPSRLEIPTDIEKVVLPLSIAAAELDQMLSKEQADETKKILNAKSSKSKDTTGVEHELIWYPGAHHGFAVRADEKDTEEAARGKAAEQQAVDWFNRWFSASQK